MTNTEEKLKESEYFLLLLKENMIGKKSFDHILNAFITSARSITWIMRAEFSKVQGWEEWNKSKSLSRKEEKIFKAINTLRIDSTKRKPIKTQPYCSITIPSTSLNDSKRRAIRKLKGKSINIVLGTKEEKIEISDFDLYFRNASVEKIGRVIKSHSREDAIELCESYFRVLEKIIKECIEEFGDSDSNL